MDNENREILSHEVVTDQSDPRMVEFRRQYKDSEKDGLRKTVKLEITEYQPGPDKIKVTTQFGYYEGEPPPGYHELWRKLYTEPLKVASRQNQMKAGELKIQDMLSEQYQKRNVMNKPFQRKGSKSNTQVGNDFEASIQEYFKQKGISLIHHCSVEIGIDHKKKHIFDLGDLQKKVLVECKAHTWTESQNVPSAKITTWNQAMLFFFLSPHGYRKILFVQRDFNEKKQETLGEYYLRTNRHLIPVDVEIWEFDLKTHLSNRVI